MKEPPKINIAKDVAHTTFLGGVAAFNGWQAYRLARLAAPPPLKTVMYTAEALHFGYETIKAANHAKEKTKQNQDIKFNK